MVNNQPALDYQAIRAIAADLHDNADDLTLLGDYRHDPDQQERIGGYILVQLQAAMDMLRHELSR